MSSPRSAALQAAFVEACRLDIAVRKPGNVSQASAGHGMNAALFLASAQAARAPLFDSALGVGERIERAMLATLDVAGCNTNLGIVLLVAPLAVALERAPAPLARDGVRHSLAAVLAGLSIDDARGAYRAIAAAHPAGLGTTDAQDVAEAPTVTLLDAMRLAATRDRNALQYATGFDELFDGGLRAWHAASAHAGAPLPAAPVQAVFLHYLASAPDSHIVRKHGPQAGQRVTQEAVAWVERSGQGEALDADPAFAAWDESLKQRGLNPGTSADLTVATAFLALSLASAQP